MNLSATCVIPGLLQYVEGQIYCILFYKAISPYIVFDYKVKSPYISCSTSIFPHVSASLRRSLSLAGCVPLPLQTVPLSGRGLMFRNASLCSGSAPSAPHLFYPAVSSDFRLQSAEASHGISQDHSPVHGNQSLFSRSMGNPVLPHLPASVVLPFCPPSSPPYPV